MTTANAYETIKALAANDANLTAMCEAMIDSANVKAVLSHLSVVCSEKADHIRENWGDKTLAAAWRNASNKLDSCANHLTHDAGIGYGR